jgi:hypothetical protein
VSISSKGGTWKGVENSEKNGLSLFFSLLHAEIIAKMIIVNNKKMFFIVSDF